MKLLRKLHIDTPILFLCWVIGFIVLGYAVPITQSFGMHTLSLIALITIMFWVFGPWLYIIFKYAQLLITKIVQIAMSIVFCTLALIAQLQPPNLQNPTFTRFSVYLLIGLMIAAVITHNKELKLKAQKNTEQDKQLDC